MNLSPPGFEPSTFGWLSWATYQRRYTFSSGAQFNNEILKQRNSLPHFAAQTIREHGLLYFVSEIKPWEDVKDPFKVVLRGQS